MAKRDYVELFSHEEPIHSVKTTQNWAIGKDSTYYYKTVQEQNFSALDGKMQKNLEYMMDEKNHLNGVNPVSDIYYIEEQFITYRTKIVQGNDLNFFREEWQFNLDRWKPLFCSLIDILSSGGVKGYIFPDLFTNGNILYNNENKKLTIIDNDGIQIKENFTQLVDYFAGQFVLKENIPIFHKYFNFEEKHFTQHYNIYAFYAYFLEYFFHIELSSFLESYKKALRETERVNFPLHSSFGEALLSLFSLDETPFLDSHSFSEFCQNYQIKEQENSRILIPR